MRVPVEQRPRERHREQAGANEEARGDRRPNVENVAGLRLEVPPDAHPDNVSAHEAVETFKDAGALKVRVKGEAQNEGGGRSERGAHRRRVVNKTVRKESWRQKSPKAGQRYKYKGRKGGTLVFAADGGMALGTAVTRFVDSRGNPATSRLGFVTVGKGNNRDRIRSRLSNRHFLCGIHRG
jgi:hypothetical protein